MPFYDFQCDKCQKKHTIRLKMKEVEEKQVCSDCGGEMKRIFTSVNFNMGRPVWREQSAIDKYDQSVIDYKEY